MISDSGNNYQVLAMGELAKTTTLIHPYKYIMELKNELFLQFSCRKCMMQGKHLSFSNTNPVK